MNYYPLINKNEVKIKYVDKGAVAFIHCLVDEKIILNDTAKFIMDNCNGENDVLNIVKIIYEKYKYIDIKTIQNDVMESLKVFDKYGVIDWKKRMNPFILFKNYKGLEFHEIYLNSLYFIKYSFQNNIRNININKNQIMNKDIFSQLLYLNYTKAYFVRKNEILVTLVIMNNEPTNYIWKIVEISYNTNPNFDIKNEFNTIASYMARDLKESLYHDSKYKLGIYIDIESENQQFIESMGFEKKGLLRYENDKDILSMWMIL